MSARVGLVLALFASACGGWWMRGAYATAADQHPREILGICATLLHEQHSRPDSLGVVEAHPHCWDAWRGPAAERPAMQLEGRS